MLNRNREHSLNTSWIQIYQFCDLAMLNPFNETISRIYQFGGLKIICLSWILGWNEASCCIKFWLEMEVVCYCMEYLNPNARDLWKRRVYRKLSETPFSCMLYVGMFFSSTVQDWYGLAELLNKYISCIANKSIPVNNVVSLSFTVHWVGFLTQQLTSFEHCIHTQCT